MRQPSRLIAVLYYFEVVYDDWHAFHLKRMSIIDMVLIIYLRTQPGEIFDVLLRVAYKYKMVTVGGVVVFRFHPPCVL